MYSTQMSEGYENNSSFDTRFNGVIIEDIPKFFERNEEDIINIFNLGTEHTQSIGLQYPIDQSQFLSEGNVVTLTEMGEAEYVGVIESITEPNSCGAVSESNDLITVDLFYKYDKSEMILPSNDTTERGDVNCLYYNEPIEILVEEYEARVRNHDLEMDILCVVSDNYLSELVNDKAALLSLNI